MRKAKGKRQKAKVKSEDESRTARLFIFAFCLLPFAFCLLVSSATATQKKPKKPKPALSEKEARRVIAAAPGFNLSTGAVKVKEISPAGATPVTVVADVKTAFHLVWVADERVEQTAGIFKQKRWRAVEFRTGERAWDEFDFLVAPLGAERLEAARGALEQLVNEFEAKQRESEGKTVEPLRRGALVINSLGAMGSSVVAEVAVEATFRLGKDAQGKWRVSELLIGGEPSGDLAQLWESINARKAERARADLGVVRAALEDFRRERGFYVVAEDSVVLMDHLSPRYIKRIIRLDPWHNPYRYAGTTAGYTLNSDGPDSKSGTADDVTVKQF
jgi:hypothetical protein